jgi:hypothetical protein
MDENKWACERCGATFDLDEGEGWVALTDEEGFARQGKLTPLVCYDKVCYSCADELLGLVQACNRDCLNCDATLVWGLSIMDCLRFQVKFGVISLPPGRQPEPGSIEECKALLAILPRL